MRSSPNAIVVLGLDPGTVHIGYGVVLVNNQGFSCLGHGTLSSEKIRKPGLVALESEVAMLATRFSPTHCALERNFFGRNRISAMSVGETRGVLRYFAEKHSLPLVELGPHEVKERLCGYGRADKKAISRMVSRLLGLGERLLTPDAADALALALTAALEISGKARFGVDKT